MDTQDYYVSFLNNVGRFFLLSTFLYPLDRFQTVKQIQSTYANALVKNQKNIITKCTHYGIRATFRGGFLTIFRNITLLSSFNTISNKLKTVESELLKYGLIASLMFSINCLVYPLQILKIRICSDLQSTQIYKNVRECFNKVKLHERNRTFYNGMSIGYVQLMLQFMLLTHIYQGTLKAASGANLPSNGLIQFIGAYIISEALLYPLDTIKKLYQINGALGHTNENPSYKIILQRNSHHLYKGFGIRLLNCTLYSFFWLNKQKDQIA